MEPPEVMLDLACGVGGAAMGYHQAWPETKIIGVDNVHQANYPFEFHCMDMFEFLSSFSLDNVGFIHGSPPCKRWAARQINYHHPDLVTPLREVLYRCRNGQDKLIPWCIENVAQAPLRRDVQLCGTSFGLSTRKYELRRHRYFEFFPEPIYMQSPECNHDYTKETVSIWGRSIKYVGYEEVAIELMQMPWASWREFRDSIPPAYTKWIAQQLEREP